MGALVLMMRMEERSGAKFRSLTCSMLAHAVSWPLSSPITALPATVVQRTHECGADGQPAGALRELIG